MVKLARTLSHMVNKFESESVKLIGNEIVVKNQYKQIEEYPAWVSKFKVGYQIMQKVLA